jgi:hypothetical protein
MRQAVVDGGIDQKYRQMPESAFGRLADALRND